jgi:hypothetical protein
MPSIIVITIHYGPEDQLLRTYRSIIAHLPKPWLKKYLIYDSNPCPCQHLAQDSPKILYFSCQPKQGISRALNEATRLAFAEGSQSDYITYIHSGDTIVSTNDDAIHSHLDKVCNRFFTTPPIVFSSWYLGNECDGFVLRHPKPEKLIRGMHVSHIGTLIPLSFHAMGYLYDPTYAYAMDYKYFTTCLLLDHSNSISIPDFIVAQVNDDGISSANGIKALIELHKARTEANLFNPTTRLILLMLSVVTNRIGHILRLLMGKRTGNYLIATAKSLIKP